MHSSIQAWYPLSILKLLDSKGKLFFEAPRPPPPSLSHTHRALQKREACAGPVYLEHKHIQGSDVRLKEERGEKSKPLNCT